MVNQGNPYTAGYEATYQEIYTVLGDDEHDRVHREHECRACGSTGEVIEVLMETLAGKLTQDEFYAVAILLARTGTGVKDRDGNVRIDWWGEMNDAVNEDGTYDWPEGGCDV